MLNRILLSALALGTTLAAQGLDDQERLIANRKKKLAKPFVQHGGWMLDYDKARAKAKREGKFLLTYFTRSYAG